jgi:enoyl-CoA hydratase
VPGEIEIARDGGVATVTLAAPERRNALTPEMARELAAVCEELDADAAVGAVVLRGKGGYFCSGGDRATLTAAGRDPAEPAAFAAMGAVYGAFQRVGELEPPTIAAVRGGAVGAGVNLAFATDLRVVSREARIVSGFLEIGLHPGGGHGTLLGRTGRREAAAAMAMFGEAIDGARAAELGLAWRAVADEQVEGEAATLAARAGADPDLARRTARSLRNEWGPPPLPWPAALEIERAAQMWSLRRRDLARES